jgi:cytochrome c-type biogenesis protein
MGPVIALLAIAAPAGAASTLVFASSGTDLSFAVAVAAGLISFLSPCVLPLVPAYLGQLTAVAVASSASGAQPSRWLAFRHALAYVAGFGLVFTVLGVTATFAAGPLVDYLPLLRQIGGVVLIVLGLNLAGLLPIAALQRVWRPLDAGASSSVAGMTGTIALAGPGGPGRIDRLGSRIVGQRGGWLASFGLGAIFAIGWTPCIGTILGGILGLAATSGTTFQGAILLVGYTLGLGIPFLIVGVLYDRAPALLRPLTAHGGLISFIGGMLVVAIGVAMLMDWLSLLPRYFQFNTAV